MIKISAQTREKFDEAVANATLGFDGSGKKWMRVLKGYNYGARQYLALIQFFDEKPNMPKLSSSASELICR